MERIGAGAVGLLGVYYIVCALTQNESGQLALGILWIAIAIIWFATT